MVPKNGSRLPKSHILISDEELIQAISDALVSELGGSHRATKTVMAWTHVSEKTARGWINGQSIPSAVNLIALSAHCNPVMRTILKAAGYENVALAFDLKTVEAAMEQTLATVHMLIENGS